MDTLSPDEYVQRRDELQNLIEICKNSLDQESYLHAHHYLGHGEIEMACESLCLSLLESEAELSADIRERLVTECLYWKLDLESVWDYDFWTKFKRYIGID